MKSYDLEDIWLVPREVSKIESRKDVNTSTLFDDRAVDLPIICSPMRDVCNEITALEIHKNGGYPILHRFGSLDDQIAMFKYNLGAACAIGLKITMSDFLRLYDAGCRTFCIDVANGANIVVGKFIDLILSLRHDVKFIVGNVASVETFKWLANINGVIGVRVGIAGGNVCTTKYATGIYHPMASLLYEIKNEYILDNKLRRVAIIADGGINSVANFVKAIALGADFCMCGSMIAATKESPAEIVEQDGKRYKVYNGSASFEIQSLYKDKPQYIEGTTKLIPYVGDTIEQLFERISDGLRSSMSYFNASNLAKYRNNIKWCVK